MFLSRLREVVFPQTAHAQLAGEIAFYWGNSQFSLPPVDFDSFVLGVALHDRAYGFIDTLPVPAEGHLDEWLELQRRNVSLSCKNIAAEIVIRLHALRLLRMHHAPEAAELGTAVDDSVSELCERQSLLRSDFESADTITALCDNVAFDFCFEVPQSRTSKVSAAVVTDQKKAVSYEIMPGGTVRLHPWPLRVSRLEGFLIAFEAENYPAVLNPVIARYSISPG